MITVHGQESLRVKIGARKVVCPPCRPTHRVLALCRLCEKIALKTDLDRGVDYFVWSGFLPDLAASSMRQLHNPVIRGCTSMHDSAGIQALLHTRTHKHTIIQADCYAHLNPSRRYTRGTIPRAKHQSRKTSSRHSAPLLTWKSTYEVQRLALWPRGDMHDHYPAVPRSVPSCICGALRH